MFKPIYAPELILEAEAADIVIRWQDFDGRLTVSHSHKGRRCTITLEPVVSIPVIEPKALTDCQGDVLALLKSVAPRRLTKPSIQSTLEKSGKIHGDTTISLALKFLAGAGLIDKPKPGTRDGYGITELGRNRCA